MKQLIKILCSVLLFSGIYLNNTNAFSQNPVCAYCGTQLPNGVHSSTCRYYVAPSSKSATTSSSAASSAADLNNAVAGALMGAILNSLFRKSPTPSQAEIEAKRKADALAAENAAIKAAEDKRIKDAKDQAEYLKMMESYKALDGSQDLNIKPLGNTDIKFKTLDIGYRDAPNSKDKTSYTPIMFGTSEEKEKAYKLVPVYNDYLIRPSTDNDMKVDIPSTDQTIFGKVIDKITSGKLSSPQFLIAGYMAKGYQEGAHTLIKGSIENILNAPSAISNCDISMTKSADQLASEATISGTSKVAKEWYGHAKGIAKDVYKGMAEIPTMTKDIFIPKYGGFNAGFRLLGEF